MNTATRAGPAPHLEPASQTGWRRTWFDIIYRHDTPISRNFDLLLVVAILASVLAVMLDSVASIHHGHARLLYRLEWAFTLLFTAEYVLRLLVVRRPLRYALSIWGVIDLLSILPTYLSLLLPGSQSLLVVRILRILRLFRILKLTRYVEESGVLARALWRSRRKIFVFISAVLTIVVIAGAVMYVIEGPANGFDNIPLSMYWAIITVATVGFGDIVPHTATGRVVTSVLVLIGYSIIAVPTGIYTAELINNLREAEDEARSHDVRGCGHCGLLGHAADAAHCRRCGASLPRAD
ncbi:ion transporter [Luteimonas sp. RD2P54]|uniref:Ion transporter n=1 Tax=Luteimonas endophytica TaxID=3042023 RepID=A0ABT6J7X3_9GAMM|nr:ion transporter [Luteimonas endophytica]MDH5822932.1 ion transporter [Luteimonas endophytica]